MNAKRRFGQFFTTNTDIILAGLESYVKNKNVVDVFAGAGNLLDWAQNNHAKSTRGYDVDMRYVDNSRVFYNDSIKNPIKCEFVLTNPPYLNQNKLDDNSVLVKSRHTDLYQLSLEKIMESDEGIVIVPVNFLSAENSKYIRAIFLEKFEIVKLNYFTEQVFDDTTYNVIAFYYRKKKKNTDFMELPITIYPQRKQVNVKLFKKHNWQIGGELLADINRYSNRLRITRLLEKDLNVGNYMIQIAHNHLNTRRKLKVDENTYRTVKNNIVILKAIDTGTDGGKICLDDVRRYGCDALVSIKTSRNQINLVFPPNVSVSDQEILIELFNSELQNMRNNYHSLFMTNYRDKNRKRISFNFAYKFINYLYFDKLNGKGADNASLF